MSANAVKPASRHNSPSFHSCVGRNLILATARIFREAEHCNCRLSANAASPQRFLPTQEWKRGQEWKKGAGMEVRGGNERYCRLSHPPPLAGGGKNSRQRIFGGWRNAAHHRPLATPRDRFALAPPPRKRRRVKNRRGVKNIFHSGESRNLILATARIFREAEHCNCRLSANAASPQRFLPTQEWKRGQEWKEGAGMEVKGGNERYCRLSHPPPLAGGGKNSRQRIFGGWRNAAHHRPLATPRDRFALAPPPQAAEGKNSFFVKKRISILAPSSIPAKAGISAATAAFADRRHWCFCFAEFPAGAGRDSRFRGNGRRGREWKRERE